MQIPNNEQPKHKSFQMPIYLALGALCALLAVLAGRDDFSLEKFLQVACNASKTSLNLLNVSSDRLSCQTQKVRADFSINPPFGRDKAGQFWYDIPSNQWLTWGSSNEPEDEFVINVAWKKTPDEYSGNLRQGLRNMNRFRHGKIQVGTYYKVSDVHGGMFELLPFFYRDQGLEKQCLAFTNKQRHDIVLIRGWTCAKPQSTPAVRELECLLSTLVIDDVLKQDRSQDWCSSSKQLLQS